MGLSSLLIWVQVQGQQGWVLTVYSTLFTLFFILTQEHESQGGGVQLEDAEQPLRGRQAHSSHGLIFGLLTQKLGKFVVKIWKKIPNSNLIPSCIWIFKNATEAAKVLDELAEKSW